MPSEASGLPEPALKDPVETRAMLSSGGNIAARLRGFGPLGILAILVIFAGNGVVLPLSAVLVLVWARLSRTPWREIGYVQPRSWISTVVVGIAFGCAFKFLMKTLVMPLLGADSINQAYPDFGLRNPLLRHLLSPGDCAILAA